MLKNSSTEIEHQTL